MTVQDHAAPTFAVYCEHIPFFNDLPAGAVPLAAKLWDTVRRPGFNSVTAYQDFVHDLTIAGIEPPGRWLFKRWVTGVQGNLIKRPGTFIDALPEEATAALQAAWDKASIGANAGAGSGGFTDSHIFESFRRDLKALGLKAPLRPEFAGWLKAVKAGAVERPAKQISSGGGAAPTLEEAARDFEARAVVLPILPDDRAMRAVPQDDARTGAAAQSGAMLAVRSATGRLVEELVSELSADIEKTAREHAARMLREVAAEMEGGAA